MTQMPAGLPPHQQEIVTTFQDSDGNEVLRTKMTVRTELTPDGLKEEKKSEDIQTTDNVSWNPSMRLRANGAVDLVTCTECRKKSHGLCTAGNAKRCVACGDTCCPRHIRLCSDDKHRCLGCARRHRVRSWFTWLLSTPVDE